MTHKIRKEKIYVDEEDADSQDESYSMQVDTRMPSSLNTQGKRRVQGKSRNDSTLKSVKQKMPDISYKSTRKVSGEQKLSGSDLYKLKYDEPLPQKSNLAPTGTFDASFKEKRKIDAKRHILEYDSFSEGAVFFDSEREEESAETLTSVVNPPFGTKTKSTSEDASNNKIQSEFNIELETSSAKPEKTIDYQPTNLMNRATSHENTAISKASQALDVTGNFSDGIESFHRSLDFSLYDTITIAVKAKAKDDTVLSKPAIKNKKDFIIPRANKSVGIQVNDPNEQNICDTCHRRKYSEYCDCEPLEEYQQILSPSNEESPPSVERAPNIAFTVPHSDNPVSQTLLECLLLRRPMFLLRSELRRMNLKRGMTHSSDPSTSSSKIPQSILKPKSKFEEKRSKIPKMVTFSSDKIRKPKVKDKDELKPIKQTRASEQKEKKQREMDYKKYREKGKMFSKKLAKAAARGKVNYDLSERVVRFN